MHKILKTNRAIAYTVLLLLIIATLFFKKENINSMSIMALIVFWLFDSNKDLKGIIREKYLIAFILFFLVSLYGLFISENKEYGLKILQRNLPFLIFPFIFHRLKSVDINHEIVKFGFVFSTFVATIYCQIANLLHWQWVNSFSTNDFSLYDYFTHSWFTYSKLSRSIDLQPSFFALFILVSVVIILHYLIIEKKVKRLYLLLGSCILLYFTVFLFQLSSRIGIIVFVLILGYYFYMIRIKKRYKIILLGSSVLLFSLLIINSRFMDRISELQTLVEESKDKGDNSLNVKKIRIHTLKAFANQDATDIIFGQGTGDAQTYLNAYYKENILVTSGTFKKQWKVLGLHYHNQFIQTFGETGIFGFSTLMLILYLLFKRAYLLENKEHVILILICVMFFLADSVLVRHKGLVFFVVMNLFFSLKRINKIEKIQ
jgi:O-antigen ligase